MLEIPLVKRSKLVQSLFATVRMSYNLRKTKHVFCRPHLVVLKAVLVLNNQSGARIFKHNIISPSGAGKRRL